MSISYTLRESLSGFRRARLSTLLAILTTTIALVLLGLFVVINVNAQRLMQKVRDRVVEMEAFLQQPLAPEDLNRIGTSIRGMEGVDHVTYVTQEEAARIFKEDTGEDVYQILSFNPLPPSYKVFLKQEFLTVNRASALHQSISEIAGVDTVVYRQQLLELLDTRTSTVNTLSLSIGLLVALSALLLVSNTIRLAIYAKRHITRTMQLVGATGTFIRLPFLLEGVLQGLCGGILASSFLVLLLERLLRLVSGELADFMHMPPVFYGGVVLAGVVLGLAGALVSVLRFLPRT